MSFVPVLMRYLVTPPGAQIASCGRMQPKPRPTSARGISELNQRDMLMGKRDKQLVINGLFIKTFEVRKSSEEPPPMVKQFVLGRCIWDSPQSTTQKMPAYLMHEENFGKFVKRLEKLTERAEKAFSHYLHHEIIVKGSHLVGYRGTGSLSLADLRAAGARLCSINGVPVKNDKTVLAAIKKAEERNRLIGGYRKFREEYNEMFSVVVQQHEGKEFYNLRFYPRSGNSKINLFRRFVDAYLKLHKTTSVSPAGKPPGTYALTPDEQRRAEKIRSKRTSVEKRSTKLIADTLLGNRSQQKPSVKKREAMTQTVKRHLRRTKQSRQQ